ncbi:MAG: SUMF1/EgtB/PvdO family nonheme iron enzyme [Thermoanaerobaculia bacterium]|nr:SUMF1/EgtB/PvdO family nonheme iron enzyme [Thermoanaerobaculia bacterium]
MKTKRRFPGINPFKTEEQDRFFGRDADIRDLYALIALEKTVVLFGKSGHGKSSLLNAGIVPRLLAEKSKIVDPTPNGEESIVPRLLAEKPGSERWYEPLAVKFGAWVPDKTAPAETTRAFLAQAFPPGPDAACIDAALPPGEAGDTLWLALKRSGQRRVVLIFDQFEEFFTYPLAQQQRFADELSQALHGDLPPEVAERYAGLPEDMQNLLAARLDVKAVFAIREDRLHLMDKLKYPLPAIFGRRYALHPLPRTQAQEALERPAGLPGFDTPAFGFAPEAMGKILDFLADEEGRVETNQLQILAESFERRAEQEGVTHFTPENLGTLKTIVKDYYLERIDALPGEAERLAARRLCEEGLAQEGDPPVRLNLHEAQIGRFYGIEPALLETLVANRLLRAEPGAGGGYTYELPHDTLLEPVLELKRERLEQQRKEELAAEEARIAREKAEAQRRQRRAMLTSVIAGVLVLGAAISIWIAYQQSKKAANAVGLAEQKTRDAEISDSLAQVKTRAAAVSDSLAGIEKGNAKAATRTALAAQKEADQKTKEAAVAQEAARIAEVKAQAAIKQSGIDSEKARQAKIEAEQKKQEANEATLLANQAKAEAERLTQVVVTNLLAQSRDAILHLDYNAAFSLLVNAASLGTVRDSVAYELMEIAFFRFHAGQSAQAIEPFEMAAKLLGKPGISQKNDIGDALNALDKDRDSLLNARYFPVMVEMKDGAYQMQGKYETAVPNFRMAETETTVWQYNLFCWANGRDITQRIGGDGKMLEEAKYQPSWGWIGDNPVVYVNWYDAVEYANWLSRKMNCTPAYAIKPGEKDSLNENRLDDFKWTVTLPENARGYRLPTEAEWEYAAKGGARHDTFKYSGSDEIDEVAWYGSNSDSRTQAVRAKKANGAGLYDMSGNVWEWCFDWYGDLLPAETPWGAKSGSYRVIRGGSWNLDAEDCLPAYRSAGPPRNRTGYYGFRLVLVP